MCQRFNGRETTGKIYEKKFNFYKYFLAGHLIKEFHIYEIFDKCAIVLTTKIRRNTSLAAVTCFLMI